MTALYVVAIVIVIIITSFILAIVMSCCIVGGKCSREEETDISNTNLEGCIIAVDFDNTIAITKYPEIIEPIDMTIFTLKQAKERGATIILWTCREGKELEDAVNWCKENNVPIDYVNENTPERIEKWGNDCRKIGADVYIDDRAINPSIWLSQMKMKG